MPGIEPGAFTVAVRYPNHYAIDDHNFQSVKLIQYKIENLFPTTLQMEEVGNFFFKRKYWKHIIWAYKSQ
jgi:hypothetical protein